ncbi:hypothetical protein C8J98_10231 [Luteibacter sp. OK325]|uniref:hypothetical protein n=1 Tax=Luteibacter sp. OK325 TaxID=2135670 RepID=UPI000D3ACEB5|nr:hypothetical protein [Luteibacter sp. OK325]PTR33846.1 hypothetical protein C8J98_10231 [Luteibacter sp. OK325]
MGKKPVVGPQGRHSTVIVAQWGNPLVRGSTDVLKSVSDNALLAEVPLPYAPGVTEALADGTITRPVLAAPLKVTVAKWDQTEEEDLVFLFIDGNAVGDPSGVPIKDQPDPMQLTIPVADMGALSEASHEIIARMGSGFGDSYVTKPATIIIDMTPPGGITLPKIDFDDAYEQNGVTLAQVVADGNVLKFTIASYDDQQDGDLIKTFIQTIPALPALPATETAGPEIPVGNTTEEHSGAFTLAQLQAAAATGNVEFWYDVYDKALNKKTADRAPLRMLVSGSPDLLSAPRVLLFSDDNLIHEGDARTPIEVEIPQFGHGDVGDVIWLLLGDALPIQVDGPLIEADLPTDPAVPDPTKSIRTISVPYQFIAALQPVAAGVVNPVFGFDVRYEVRRGIFSIPSPPLAVKVDLTLAGGEDPDPETPVHGRLQGPTVRHSAVGAIDNEIPIGYTLPVFAVIPHLTKTPTQVEVFEAGDEVQLYRLEVDGATEVPIGDKTKAVVGADLNINFKPAQIVPGSWQVFYKVGRTLATGQVNEALSPAQTVVIQDPGGQPGGPDVLPEAVFREGVVQQGQTLPSIGYTRASNGTIVRVYNYLNMKVDDKIDLVWQGNDKLRGDGADIADAKLSLTHTVVAEDLLEKDDRLDDDLNPPDDPVMRIFVDFDIPYEEMKKIRPSAGSVAVAYGSARAFYTVKALAGGANASKPDPKKAEVLVIDARPPKP